MFKHILTILLVLFGNSMIQAQALKQSTIQMLSETSQEAIIDIQTGGLKQHAVFTPLGWASGISIDQGTALLEKGAPDLPKLSFSLIIPADKQTQLSVESASYTDYQGVMIAPSKGNLNRTQKPSEIPYVFSEVYQKDAFYPSMQAVAQTPFILRDYRGQTIHIQSVQYNPLRKVLRVYHHIKLKVSYVDGPSENPFPQFRNPEVVVREFDNIYTNLFLNYGMNKPLYSPMTEEGSMLVLCPASYLNEIEPFIRWKEMKGIQTFLVNTDTLTGGVFEPTVLNLVSSFYAEKQITYLLIVGDHPNIPTRNASWSQYPDILGPSDNAYAYQSGNDHNPEFIVGRFSGETVDDIRVMVQRTLAYEKSPNTMGNWFSKQIGMASNQGPGDDWEYDHEHIRDICDSNINQYSYTQKFEFFDGDQGGMDSLGSPSIYAVTNAFNSGIGMMNYCGHGSVGAFSTSGFGENDIPNLTNTQGNWPFIFSTACVNGDFVSNTCLAEAFLRARNSANLPTGAIAVLMSTINQSWDPPMQGQDEMNGILRGARPGNKKTTFGSLAVNGCLSVNEHYNTAANPDGGNEITDTWTVFGDPTLVVKTAHEGQLICNHHTEIGIGSTSFVVASQVDGTQIGLYYQGKFLASKEVTSSLATFTGLPAFNTIGDTVWITGTKQNYTPYSGYAVVINAPTAVNDFEENLTQIYPNPAHDYIQIRLPENISIHQIQLMDLTGRLLIQQNDDATQLDLRAVPAGVYQLLVHTKEGKFSRKVIRQ